MLRPRNPLYAKAPVVLLRFPVLLAGLVLGIVLLSLVVAVFPLGMSAAGNRFLQGEARKGIATRYGVGITYENENVRFAMHPPAALHHRMEQLFEREAARIDTLGEPFSSIRGPQVRVEKGDDAREGRLFYRENALAHVRIVDGEPGSGVFIADAIADPLGIAPGDTITLSSGRGHAEVRVDGIYAALYKEWPVGFWRPWRSSIYPACPGDPGTSGCTPPPPFIIASKDVVLRLARQVGATNAAFGFDAPVRDLTTFTIEDGTLLEAAYQDLARRMATPGTELNDVFMCCGQQYVRESRYLTETRLSSVIPQIMTQTEERLAAAEIPLRLLQVIAIVVAGTSLLAAALYSFAARRTEVSFLYARGFTVREVAAKVALESAIPAAVAAAAGATVALLLVRAAAGLVPISDAAVKEAVVSTGAAAAIAVIAVAVAAGALFHRWKVVRETNAAPTFLRTFGEATLIVMCLAVIATAATEDPSNRVEWSLVIAPLAVLTITALLAAHFLRAVLAGLARSSRRLPHALHLAIRRAAATRIGLLLFGLGTLFFGVFQNGLSIATALNETVVAKSLLFVGSDVAATVDTGDVPPPDLAWPATAAWRIPHAALTGDGGEVDAIAVDPQTLPDAAHWDERYGERSIEDLMKALDQSRHAVPAVFVGVEEANELDISIAGTELEARRIATVSAFPGMVSRRPAVVVAQEDLERIVEEQRSGLLGSAAVTAEWWVRGDSREISAALPKLADPPYTILTAHEVRDIPYISTTLTTFKILDLLGIVGGALVLVAALAYLQSAERARAVSTQLALRMQLRRRSLVAAAVLELVLLVAVAYLIALVPASSTARLLAGKLDPLQTIPPDVMFTLPAGWFALGGIVTTLAVLVGGVLVALRAMRADMAALMRVAE